MTIRAARCDEADVLSRLARVAKAVWGYSAAQLERWRDDLTASPESIRRWPTFVAERDGAVAGFIQLNSDGAPWQIEHLWVAPRHLRRGVGRALLSRAAEAAAAKGQTLLAIDADPNAEPFYLAAGATRVGEVAAPIDGQPDRVRPLLRLTLRASGAKPTSGIA